MFEKNTKRQNDETERTFRKLPYVNGGYYAMRLALLEFLKSQHRQARCIIFKEIDENHQAPVGVWEDREIARNALRKKITSFGSLNEALNDIKLRLKNPIKVYNEQSKVLLRTQTQRKLTDFF